MNCPNCGRNLEAHHKYCADCGTPVMPYDNAVKTNETINNEVAQPVVQTVPNVATQPVVKSQKNNNKLLYIIIGILSVILIVIVVLAINKTSGESNKLVIKDKGTRTIMIYGIGADLESKSGMLSEDIEEMIKSNFNDSDINLLVYTGGSKRWHNKQISSNENAIFEVNKDGLKKVKVYDKKSMVEPETLTEFLDYAYNNYKTDLYDLILWDHGGGPINGYGVDEMFPGYLSVNEIDKALNDSLIIKNTKFEMIGFDACLMGSIEVANTFKEEANYLIVSEEAEPGSGWDYDYLKTLNRNTTSVEMGKNIVDKFDDYYKKINKYLNVIGQEKWDTTLSLLDLSKVDNVIRKIDSSFVNLSERVAVSNYSTIREGVKNTTQYSYGFEVLDLYDLTLKLGVNLVESEKLRNAISEMVVYEKNNMPGSHGISIFYPIAKMNNYQNLYNAYYKNLSVSKAYEQFLFNVYNIYNGKKSVASFAPTVTPDNLENLIYVSIDEKTAEEYRDAEYTVFIRNEFGEYSPAVTSYDTIETESIVYGDKITKKVVLSDNTGKSVVVYAKEHEKKDEYTIYRINLSLKEKDSDEYEDVIFYVQFDKGSTEGKVIRITENKEDEEMPMAGRTHFDLSKYELIKRITNSFDINSYNQVIIDWSTSSKNKTYEFNVDNFKFTLDNINDDVQYIFRINSIEMNSYYYNATIED